MRKKMLIALVSAFVGISCLVSGCQKETEPEKEENKIEETADNKEETVDDKEEEIAEAVSEPAIQTEPEGLSKEQQKMESEFQSCVKETKKAYKQLSKTVDVNLLDVDQKWEYSYFKPLILYYGELSEEGFENLTEDEMKTAKQGIDEVSDAIKNWK